ncbi:MAG: HDIG domain-containing protein [Candidatus Aegiribacteria sp.]|nr:HDIG domain-containing protein [Candidatus Aegiribacteria sp.]
MMKTRNFLSGSLVAAVFIGTFYLFFMPDKQIIDLKLSIGQTLPHDIVAPVDFHLPYHEQEFSEIRDAMLESIPVHLRLDREVWQPLRNRLYPMLLLATYDSSFARGMLEELSSIYEEGVFNLDDVREYYDGEQAVLLDSSGTEDRQLFDINEIEDVRDILEIRMARWDFPGDELTEISSILRPNLIVNDSSRQANAEIAVAGLSNIDTTITAGSVLLKANEQVTSRTIEYLYHLKNTAMGDHRFKNVAGLFLLVLLISGIMLFYIHDIMPDTWKEANRFLLLGVIWIISFAATGTLWLALKNSTAYPCASLVTFGAALTSIFFHRRHAIFFTLTFSMVLGLVHPHPYSIVLISAVSGILASLTVWDVRERRSVPVAIGLAGGGGVAVYLLLRMLNTSLYSSSLTESILSLLLVPVIGIGSAHALLFLFERIFRVYTVLSIDEVNKTDHPLLKKMGDVAPGTWNHSQTVAELAGRAAGAINARESLASAGGYFHDIGKMAAPELFIENQRNMENPHDNMNPWESAGKIISHVKDGVEMAEKAKLPKAVIDIIQQHHGVGLTKYFYNKALQESSDPKDVKKNDFSYTGPRPSTIEAALVLLADQASSFTQNLTSPEGVAELVGRVVGENDLEGELDDCHLTRRNLKTIVKVFTSVLESKFHKRVSDYPIGDSND